MSPNRLPSVKELTDLQGQRVLVRAEFNVPMDGTKVLNDFRLMRAVPTIQYLKDQGAKVIVIAHLGRDPELSLAPVCEAMQQYLPVQFSAKLTGETVVERISELQDGNILVLENLRSHEGETGNDPVFAETLASYADYYVNDCFSVSHREHASVVGVTQHLPSYFGLSFIEEFEGLQKALAPEHPALFLLGGAKFATKAPLVAKYLEEYDHVFVGGALAHDFFKLKGYELGTSLVSDEIAIDEAINNHPSLLLPVDVVVESAEGERRVTTPDAVQSNERIADNGPATVEMLKEYIEGAKTILWNGPFGDYEHGFADASKDTARIVATAAGYSVLGGGDTIAVIDNMPEKEQFDFLSTAGGAMLTFLEHGTLPAITAVTEK